MIYRRDLIEHFSWLEGSEFFEEVIEVAGATVLHMEVGVRDLRNRTAQVVDAVRAGERVVLTVNGDPVADIVPHGARTRWLSGDRLREQLRDRSADPALRAELEESAGQTLDEL